MTPEERSLRLQYEQERLQNYGQSSSPEVEDNEVSEEPQVNRDEIRQASQEAQPVQKDRGLVTKGGEFLEYATSKDPFDDGLNAIVSGLNKLSGGRLQGLDDAILSSGEMEQREIEIAEGLQKRREEGKMSAAEQISHTTANALTGIAEGGRSGLALPVTGLAVATGQDAPWSTRPEVLKNSPVGESLFNITEILVPTLLTSGVASALGAGTAATGLAGLTAESAIESVQQADGISEQLLGRRLAEEIGVIAEKSGLTTDGAQLTRDLIENKKGTAVAVNFVVNTLVNLGVNVTADQVMKRILGPAYKSVAKKPEVEKASQVLKKNPEKVQEAIEDVSSPEYKASAEPGDVLTVDTAVPVSKPTKTYISEPAAVAEALRRNSIGEDGLTAADRKYFTNWDAVTKNEQLQTVLQNATKTLEKLKDYPDDIKFVQSRALKWWDQNKEMIDNDLDGLTLNFQTDMTAEIPELTGVSAFTKGDELLKKYSITNSEGFIATALVAEELGVRMQKLAIQARLLENAEGGAIDFSNVVEQLAVLHEKAALFLIPWRRAKRKWAVEGMVQQRKTIEGLQDADVQSAIKKKDKTSYLGDPKEFDKIKVDEDDAGSSFRDLWEAYRNPANPEWEKAGKTLKVYIDTISSVSPENVIGAANNLTGTLKQQLKKANLDATSNLYYQYLLTRLRPQVVSVGSNMFRLFLEPLGAIASRDKGQRAYGRGQFVGGWQALGDGINVFFKTFKENQAVNSGSKIQNISEVAKQQVTEEKLYEDVLRKLKAENAPWYKEWGAAVNHMRRQLAFHPYSNLATRGLQAGDEATKAVFASQVATGRAYQEFAFNPKPASYEERLSYHMNKIFKDGVKGGKILDEEVLDAAKHLTFQTDIPTDGNFVDNMFLAAQNATETSRVWRFFNPFARLTYNVMEASGRMMFGMMPGGGTMLSKIIPRYQKILSGEMGDVAKVQFKSQLNIAKVFGVSAVALSAHGFMTGNDSGDLPKKSFIIPANNKEGYIALSYSSIEPYAMPLSVMADLATAYNRDIISHGEYEDAIAMMIYSLGMASTDKSFAMGIAQMSALLNVKNFGEGTIGAMGGSLGTALVSQSPIGGGAPGGIIRAGLQHFQPYKTVQSNEGNIFETFWAKMSNRLIGGVGVPVMYDELTGRKLTKVATTGDDIWAARAGSLLGEAVFPGAINNADRDNEVKIKLRSLDYSKDVATSNRYYDGTALTLQQQSDMSLAMYEVGLPTALKNLFDSPKFKKAERRFEKLKSETPYGWSKEGTEAYKQMQAIHRSIDQVYRRIKKKAAKRVLYSGTAQSSVSPERSSLNNRALNVIGTVNY